MPDDIQPDVTDVTPAPTPAYAEPTPLTPDQVEAWLAANNYVAIHQNDPAYARAFSTPDPDPTPVDYDPFDKETVARLVEEKTKGLSPSIAESVTKQVMAGLTPILNTFAQSQLTQGVREEAKPYVQEIMKEFNVTPFQVAQDQRTAKLINEAAEARAIKAGKIGPSILFPNEPPFGSMPTPAASEDAQALRQQVEFYQGRALTDEEFAPYLKEAGLE